jgi:drug/metabolite transporter (DMT)-like permease|tara:strand:+ start:2191 stop:2565 length:375 start_codon:yes stop_codon:yes gene_type:complete
MSIGYLNITFLVCFAFIMSLGQLLFKKAALSLPPMSLTKEFLLACMVNVWLVSAVAFYGVATVLWVCILQRVPLSLAYPFAALAFILVPAAAWLLFNEAITKSYLVGMAFIILGIITITTNGQS